MLACMLSICICLHVFYMLLTPLHTHLLACMLFTCACTYATCMLCISDTYANSIQAQEAEARLERNAATALHICYICIHAIYMLAYMLHRCYTCIHAIHNANNIWSIYASIYIACMDI